MDNEMKQFLIAGSLILGFLYLMVSIPISYSIKQETAIKLFDSCMKSETFEKCEHYLK